MEPTSEITTPSAPQAIAGEAVNSNSTDLATARSEAAKAADSRIFVQVHTTDVEAIRAALALKPPKRKGVPTLVWLAIALAILVAAFAAWQWAASKAARVENVQPPQVMAPRPPDFAFNVSAPNPPANPERYAAHPSRGRSRTRPRNGN